jgi:pimeloyl-ACP methyl ester carboxylesterase
MTRTFFREAVVHTTQARDGTGLVWRAHPPGTGIPIVLSNGLSTIDEFFRDVVQELAPRYRVIDWSYRGHGGSDSAKSGDYSIAAHADDLVRVTEDAASEPAVHVAFSMGVAVALEAYRRRPDLVRAFVLIAGGADGPYASSGLMHMPLTRAMVKAAVRAVGSVAGPLTPVIRGATNSRALFPLARGVGALGKHAPRDVMERFFRGVGEMDQRAYWSSLASLMDAHASDLLPKIHVPTLVLAPERDMMALRADLVALHAGIQGAEWELFEGTGHALLVEQGPRVAARIARFLEGLATA